MDDGSWFRISCILGNYIKFLVAPQVQSTVDNRLALLRVLFAMKQEKDWKEPFKKMFQDPLRNILCFDCSQSDVENSIMNYHYRISEDTTSVTLIFAEQNPTLNITETQLCVLHEECEKIITKLVEDHCKSHEKESVDHCKSCDICFNKERLKRAIRASKPSAIPTQELKAASEFITLSLCDNSAANECNSLGPLRQESNQKERKNNTQPSEVEEQSNKRVDDELENFEDGGDKTVNQILSQLSLGDNPALDECNSRSLLGQVPDKKEAKNNKQPSEAMGEGSESVDDEIENFEDEDDKTVKQISSQLSLGYNPALDECNSRSILGQVTDEKEAKNNKQPSEAVGEGSEGVDDEIENFDDEDDKTVKQILSQLSLGDNPAPDECNSRSSLGQVPSDEKEAKNKQPSEVEEQSNKSVKDELENFEHGDDKEEKLPEGDKTVQLKGEIAALRKGHSGKAKSKKKRKLELELEKTKQENSALQEEIQARSEASETYMAWRTQFRTALDSHDKTLSNLNEKLEALVTEKLECEEDYESQIRLLKSSLKENVDNNVKLEAEVAELTSLATVGAEFATEMPSSSHNSKTGTFKNHKQERLKAAKADKEFWGKNKNKIKDEIEKREDKPNYVLTYFDRSQKKHVYKLFAGEQEAHTWTLRNKDRMKKSYPFIRIRTMEEVDELTTTDLLDVKIELLDPSTGKVLCERMGMFDIGADIASFPYDPEIFKQLMNSVKKINDELVPIVYAKLRIDGEELEKIYPIEVESDKDWCNFGIPQMQDSSETTKRRILQRIDQSFGVAVA